MCVCVCVNIMCACGVCLFTSNVYVLMCVEGEPASTGGQHASGAGER